MVGNKMKFPSSGFADVIKSESIDCKDLLSQLQRYGRRQSKRTAVDDPETLSDIDDEFCTYFNTKEEMRFKKALWEKINKEQTKKKCTKRAAEGKIAGAVKKASKVTVEAAGEAADKVGNEKRRSSKINYDALDKLEADWNILEM